jgi:hypothetical protein
MCLAWYFCVWARTRRALAITRIDLAPCVAIDKLAVAPVSIFSFFLVSFFLHSPPPPRPRAPRPPPSPPRALLAPGSRPDEDEEMGGAHTPSPRAPAPPCSSSGSDEDSDEEDGSDSGSSPSLDD